jgi:hypothetical protein
MIYKIDFIIFDLLNTNHLECVTKKCQKALFLLVGLYYYFIFIILNIGQFKVNRWNVLSS